MKPTELAYRQTAVQGASGFGLLIALYDTIAANLLRAADAQRAGDIETRCGQVSHALLVLGYLEDWVEPGADGDLAKELLAFYSNLRSALLRAEAKQSAELIEQNVAALLKVRKTWQELEYREPTPTPLELAGGQIAHQSFGWQDQGATSSWSA